MNHTTKKILSMLLVLCMVLGIAACGTKKETNKASESTTSSNTVSSSETAKEESKETVVEEPKDPVTITYYYCGIGEQEYTGEVEEKLNEILKGLEGYEHITIDLMPYALADYVSGFTLAQANGDQIDLVSNFMLDVPTMVKNGDLMPLDDLMVQFPGVTSELPDWMVNYGKVFGTQYYIPTQQQAAKLSFFYMPEDYLNMYYEAEGKTRADVSATIQLGTVEEKLDMYEAMLLAVREGTGLDTKYLHPNLLPRGWVNTDDIDSDDGMFVLIEGQDEVVYWPLTEAYQTISKRYWDWKQAGYLHPEAQTIKSSDFTNGNFMNDEAIIFSSGTNACSEEDYAAMRTYETFACDAIRITPHPYIPSKYAAGGISIYADCEHPEEAMMIMELLNTKKGAEFYNTFVWGLEGIHYEWVDESVPRIKTLEYDGTQADDSASYGAWSWNTGNSFNAWLNQSSTNDNWFKYIDEEIHNGADTAVSPASGITWDLSGVEDQLSQIKAVYKEYKDMLPYVENWDAKYEEFVSKLKAAGVEEVLDVLNKQLKDHMAK